MNDLAWQIPLGIFTCIIVIRFLLAPYWIYKAKSQEVTRIMQEQETLQRKLQDIENSKPNLKFKKAQDWQFYKNGQPIYHALQVWFVNDPQVASDNSVAKDVTAVITFYDRTTKNKPEIHGCFTQAEFPDYATIAPIEDLLDNIGVWSPNAIPRKLLIALKYPGDESAYAFARSNFKEAPGGRTVTKEIKKGEHYVRIAFKGVGIDQSPSWFILTNPGKDGNLSLSEPIKKPNLHKEGFQTE